ncbi:hypothetical protein AGROH133_14031 [Agrobacterium tumefaciens]|nr:hypothetical protein AGROH133_14031 [Agrobacterium tumefaciens]
MASTTVCASRSVRLSDWVPGRYRLVERRLIQILSVKTPVCRYTQIDYQPKKCHARGVTSTRRPSAHVGAYGIVNEIRNRSRARYVVTHRSGSKIALFRI